MLNYGNEVVLLANVNTLSIISSILFIAIVLLALLSDSNYLFFLPFQLLAMPSSVDDMFMSISLTALTDSRKIFFPLFTHIDIYLILGILRKVIVVRPKIILNNFFITMTLVVLLLGIIVNLFYSSFFKMI